MTFHVRATDPGINGNLASTNLKIVDEYGVYTRDLGTVRAGTFSLEAWARDEDKDGRRYTIIATAVDKAGNTDTDTVVVKIEPKPKAGR